MMRVSIVLVAALLLIGCPGNQRGEDQSQNSPPKTSTTTANPQAVPEKSIAAPPPNQISGAQTPAASPQIEVQLSEYEIRMPESIAAGTQTFHVVDGGHQNHNFAIEGNGVSQKLVNDLTRGDSADMVVNLKPGRYTVYCPVDKHRARGMERTLTVR